VKIASSSRLSKSKSPRHPFHVYSLIQQGRRSKNTSKGSAESSTHQSPRAPQEEFFANKDPEQFIKHNRRKDFSNFVDKDLAWMKDKGKDGKIVMPSYTHHLETKKPARPIHGRIFRQFENRRGLKAKRAKKHINTQSFLLNGSAQSKFLSDSSALQESKNASYLQSQKYEFGNLHSQTSSSLISQED
jgi:hypothetical protein